MSTPVTIKTNYLPVVALIGRVNVGKSTLFNKLIEENKAIVSDIPGTTRNTNEGLVLWRGRYIKLIDTGGLSFTDTVPLEKEIFFQSERAMKEADLILFVTDGQEGVLPQEKELGKRIRRISDKPVILVANKIDNTRKFEAIQIQDFLKLGLGEPFSISATNGRNVGDLLDFIYQKLGKTKRRPKQIKEDKNRVINISIIGKPNTGKSSLFNKLIGEDKVIVSDLPHTTREPHDTLVTYPYQINKKKYQQTINFIDTAGIRRKTNVEGSLERAGIYKSIQSIANSDLVLFVLDGSESISSQDRQLGGLLERKAKSVIIILNKWDLAEDTGESYRKIAAKMIMSHFPHLDFAPIVFVSAKTGYRTHTIFPTIMDVWQARHTTIPDPALSSFLKYATDKHLPSKGKGTRKPVILGLHQINVAPPVFEMFIKYRTSLHRSYVNFIENKLREQFDFLGTPIIIKLRKTKI